MATLGRTGVQAYHTRVRELFRQVGPSLRGIVVDDFLTALLNNHRTLYQPAPATHSQYLTVSGYCALVRPSGYFVGQEYLPDRLRGRLPVRLKAGAQLVLNHDGEFLWNVERVMGAAAMKSHLLAARLEQGSLPLEPVLFSLQALISREVWLCPGYGVSVDFVVCVPPDQVDSFITPRL